MKANTIFEKVFYGLLLNETSLISHKLAELRHKHNDELAELKKKDFQELIQLKQRQSSRRSKMTKKHRNQILKAKERYAAR